MAADGTIWLTGSTDFIAAQYDESGKELQRIVMLSGGDAGWGAGQAIRILNDGDILVGGMYKNNVDLGGGPLGDVTPPLSSGFLARYSATGKYVTSLSFSENTGVENVGLATGPGGSVVLTGSMNMSPNAFGCSTPESGMQISFIARLNDSLAAQWVTFALGAGTASVDSQGKITVPVKTLKSDNVYLMTLDATGTQANAWATVSGLAASYRIAATRSGITYVSGSFSTNVSFGTTQITTDGMSAYLLSITP